MLLRGFKPMVRQWLMDVQRVVCHTLTGCLGYCRDYK